MVVQWFWNDDDRFESRVGGPWGLVGAWDGQ